jgi:hypothetical protein
MTLGSRAVLVTLVCTFSKTATRCHHQACGVCQTALPGHIHLDTIIGACRPNWFVVVLHNYGEKEKSARCDKDAVSLIRKLAVTAGGGRGRIKVTAAAAASAAAAVREWHDVAVATLIDVSITECQWHRVSYALCFSSRHQCQNAAAAADDDDAVVRYTLQMSGY